MTNATNIRAPKIARQRIALAVFAGALLLGTFQAPSARAQQAPRAKKLANGMKCMCGGCEDSAGQCSHPGGSFSGPCETARGMQKDLDDRVAKNQTDDEIMAAYVTQYGPTILIEPPKKGFRSSRLGHAGITSDPRVDRSLVRSPQLAQKSATRSGRRSSSRCRISGSRPQRSREGRP